MRTDTCPITRVPDGDLEAAVIIELRAVLCQPEIIAGSWKGGSALSSDITEAVAREAFHQLDPLWDELFPAEQARIVAPLVEWVDIRLEGLTVRLRVDGLAGLANEMRANVREAA